MIHLDNLKYTKEWNIWYYNMGVAYLLPKVFRENGIEDESYYLAPIPTAIRDGILPEGTRPPKETWLASPGSPIRKGMHMWVMISHIDPKSLEPYLNDIYMEKLRNAIEEYHAKYGKWAPDPDDPEYTPQPDKKSDD